MYAVTKNTAAEIIVQRAQSELPNMGLTSWKGSIVRKEDTFIAKNYLTSDEIDTLNRIVTLFLDTAELRVKDQIPLSLTYWKKVADKVIDFSNKPTLEGSGSISHDAMKSIVSMKYDKYDEERKKTEAVQDDNEDNEAIQKLIDASKKKL